MIQIILHGCNGRMGKALQQMIAQRDNMQIAAGIDSYLDRESPLRQYQSPRDCPVKGDVVIDFSNHKAVPQLLSYCLHTQTPVIIATTALTEECKGLLLEASAKIPVFYSANMSLGINVLMKAIRDITPALEDQFHVEIIEKHHSQKKDSPSGTAILLADTVNQSCRTKKQYLYGRHGKEDQCSINELGIHAVRGGTIPGEHTVLYAGPDEMIQLTHTALSRNIFAAGALKAAAFLVSQKPGLYSMQDLI